MADAGAAHPVIAAVDSSGGPVDRSLRITVHFHPDWVSAGRTVLEHLAQDGTYRTQFETGTSNGGLTAYPGGDRQRWERAMFDGFYDRAKAYDRPRYGALNHRRRSVGAAPRFGSTHLRLAEHVLDRATFCFPDSVFEPTRLATAARFDLWADVAAFDAEPLDDEREASTGGLLDDYVEAHVHGGLEVAGDVEALVLDPSHRDSPVQEHALRLGVPVEWHEGFRVHLDTLAAHQRFRGEQALALARGVAEEGWLDPAILGRAHAAGEHDPQVLKRVWHLLARFGHEW